MKKWLKKYGPAALSLTLLAAAAVGGLTYHKEIWALLTQESARQAFVAYVRGAGLWGMAVFMAVQILQVVVAVLPGEPVELMAGALYGTWGGAVVCELGLLLGSAMVYYSVRAAGASAVSAEALHKYRFLRDDAHVKFALFLLYFVPGTPKDILLYLGPFLPLRARSFFLIATLARIPSVLTSTYAGATFMRGDWHIAALVFGVTGLCAVLCVWKQDAVLTAIRRVKEKRAAARRALEKNIKL